MSEVIAKVYKDEVSSKFFEERAGVGLAPISPSASKGLDTIGSSLCATQFSESPAKPYPGVYFPLDDNSTGFNALDERVLNPVNSSNLSYDENGVWVGTAVENLWPIKTGNQGWVFGTSIDSSISEFLPGSIKHKLYQNASSDRHHTIGSGNSFGSDADYYTVSSYYRQTEGTPYINPVQFNLALNAAGDLVLSSNVSSHIAPMRGVYQRGWKTAQYTSSSSAAYPYIRWETGSAEARASFVAMMVEQNPFVSAFCATSRGQGELTYNLHASAGLNWNQDYTIMYWKRPHGTDTKSLANGYNAEAIGGGSKRVWFGRNQTTRRYQVNDTKGETTVDNYQYNWFLHVIRRIGDNLKLQVFRHSSSSPVVNISINNSSANTTNYYVTPQGYDFRIGGRDAGYASNSYYRDLQVMTRAMTDEEVRTYFNTKFKVMEDHISVGNMIEGVI